MNNEETIYMSPASGQNETTTKNKGRKVMFKTGWKRVAIGGVSGIMVGSAAAYAAHKMMGQTVDDGTAATASTDTEHPMATGVNDDMSFADAFAAARAEVGSDGVFTWHGNVYGTHTAAEWEAMSPQEQLDYFSSISGQEVPPHTVASASAPQQEVHHYHHTAAEPAAAAEQHVAETGGDRFIPDSNTKTTTDPEVRIVGDVETIQHADGTTTTVVPLEYDGHAAVALGDSDHAEVIIIDINDNHELDVADVVVDLQSKEMSTVGEIIATIDDDAVYAEADVPPTDNMAGVHTVAAEVEPEDMPGDIHEVSYEEPAMSEPMNSVMDDPTLDSGYDMAGDMPLVEC